MSEAQQVTTLAIGTQVGWWTITGEICKFGNVKKIPCCCRCGTQAMVNVANLLAGKSKSCGCYSAQLAKNRIRDLAGMQFGRLTAIERVQNSKHGRVCWVCECACGKQCVVKSNLLVMGKTKSCGCLKKNALKKTDLQGQKFGRLTVEYALENRSYKGSVMWHCRCICGKEIDAPSDSLINGHYVSCGCQRREWQSQIHHTLQHIDNTCIEYLEKRNARTDNTSGHQGVQKLCNGRYRAYIGFKGKQYNLGSYNSYQAAVKVRCAAEEQLHKEYVRRYYCWLAAAKGDEQWQNNHTFSMDVIFHVSTKEFELVENTGPELVASNK